MCVLLSMCPAIVYEFGTYYNLPRLPRFSLHTPTTQAERQSETPCHVKSRDLEYCPHGHMTTKSRITGWIMALAVTL